VNNKRNKAFLTWMMCGWCLLPWASQAGEVPAGSAKMLAIAESVLHFCGSVDPIATAKLQAKIKELVKGLSEQQVAQLRQSTEYQSAYSSMEEFVGKVDEHNAKQVCSESAPQQK
jgi:hypothetical protein